MQSVTIYMYNIQVGSAFRFTGNFLMKCKLKVMVTDIVLFMV